jgi:transcriptional regulator of acetoin/glycerol metabolism
MVRQALLQSGGNKSRAAKLLQVDRSTLYRKMRRYNLT